MNLVYDLNLHRLPNGRWADYALAQLAMDFVEILVTKISAVPSNTPGVAPLYKCIKRDKRLLHAMNTEMNLNLKKMTCGHFLQIQIHFCIHCDSSNFLTSTDLDGFLRLEVNILLATMQEATIFSNAEKAILQQVQFKQLQDFTANERSRIKEATVAFIKAKMAQYTTENEQTAKILERTLKKIPCTVKIATRIIILIFRKLLFPSCSRCLQRVIPTKSEFSMWPRSSSNRSKKQTTKASRICCTTHSKC